MCTRTVNEDVDPDDFKELIKADEKDRVLKILSISEEGLLDLDFYKLIRSGIKSGNDEYNFASRLSMKVKGNLEYRECYLTYRSGPRNGRNSSFSAIEACDYIRDKFLDESCYKENVLGPYFGTLGHPSAKKKCLTEDGRRVEAEAALKEKCKLKKYKRKRMCRRFRS